MKIGIDCRLWNETGVGRYIRNLVSNLSKIDQVNEYVLFARSQDERNIRSVTGGKMSIVIADVTWHGIAEQIKLLRILNKEKADLVHFPYFSVPLFYRRPFVVTVHDLIVNRFSTGRASTLPYPLYFAKKAGFYAVLSNAVYRARKIITPSHAVKIDLIATYRNVDDSKVAVTYEGGFKSETLARSKSVGGNIVEGRYVLRVGNFYPHKNIERMLMAFRDFIYDDYENHDIQLVLVGKADYFFKRIKQEIEKLNIGPNVVFLENISDVKLARLYTHAIATIVPSLAEGFSLTAVEAMSCGSPVIASDIQVHREICSSAAIYCNPQDVNDIKQKINFACSLVEESRNELIAQGKKQAKQFSWEKMAKETLQIYQSV